jgi:hypothetical protein
MKFRSSAVTIRATPLERRYNFTTLDGITNQNSTTFVVSTVRTSNVTTLHYVQNRRLFIDTISDCVVNLPSTKQCS